MTVEYLSLNPAVIETPEVTYSRSIFLYEDGHGRILDGKQRTLVDAAGTLTRVEDQAWEFTDGNTVWRIERGSGCNCG